MTAETEVEELQERIQDPRNISREDAINLAIDAIAALKRLRAERGEPVAWFDPLVTDHDKGLSWKRGYFHTEPLYAPQAAKPD
jgi:hypothetical protein